MKKRKWMYLALTIPALVLMILFIAAPLVNAVRISFFKWNGYSQKMRWYGLKNFENIFTDKLFWLATLNTFIYGFGSTILQNILGLAAALFLNNKFKGRNAVRVILYMPIMISAFIMGQILYYFVQVEGGVFNELLGLLGLSGGRARSIRGRQNHRRSAAPERFLWQGGRLRSAGCRYVSDILQSRPHRTSLPKPACRFLYNNLHAICQRR